MSTKRSRRSLALRRAGAGLLAGGLATTLVVVYVDRSTHHTETTPASATTPVTQAAHAEVAALDGQFDVDVTVVAAEYGATWPSTPLTAGQHLAQRWTFDCRKATCKVSISTGHVAEDPDGATLSTTDDRNYSVSASTPASPDDPALPPGCGAVNATDVQRLTLAAIASGDNFTGHYSLHHPTIHVEGPVGDRTGSCDSLNVELELSARRV